VNFSWSSQNSCVPIFTFQSESSICISTNSSIGPLCYSVLSFWISTRTDKVSLELGSFELCCNTSKLLLDLPLLLWFLYLLESWLWLKHHTFFIFIGEWHRDSSCWRPYESSYFYVCSSSMGSSCQTPLKTPSSRRFGWVAFTLGYVLECTLRLLRMGMWVLLSLY